MKTTSKNLTASTHIGALAQSWPLLTLIFASAAFQLIAAQQLAPSARPSVAPLIGSHYSSDTNGDRIDDQLLDRAQKFLSAQKLRSSEQLRPLPNELVNIELIFSEPVTQEQLDAFTALGGEITYNYKAISYGWNARIPLEKVPAVPAAMGASLVLVEESRRGQTHMDLATKNGRVRQVWSPNFAGSPLGYSGDTNITIGFPDTGVDDSHPDLNGRCVYWHDFTTSNYASPVDVESHGTHVAAIALGTGVAGGSAVGTLSLTQMGDLTGITSGIGPDKFPMDLPAISTTVTLTARWNGGGSTSLFLSRRAKGTIGSWTTVGSGITGTSPLTLNKSLIGDPTQNYSAVLLSNGAITNYAIAYQVPNYPGSTDGFNKLRGVAPGCYWAGAKAADDTAHFYDTDVSAALDDLVSNRAVYNIKIINLSLGITDNGGIDPAFRQKVNTTVNNGIVVTVSAGNGGYLSTPSLRQIPDPARAEMALTVAADNDINQLTEYSSEGFLTPDSTPGQKEDYKPDLIAPGGSRLGYQTWLLSADSNSDDRPGIADQQPNDYRAKWGTSLSSPFVAGCAALVIDALQKSGVTWDFNSSQHSRLVKMVLCATASESNTNREGNLNNPTLQRATSLTNGTEILPLGKDLYEGYGLVNADAAVEAVSLTFTNGTTNSATLGSAPSDRRVWARKLNLNAGELFVANLTVPATGDFDLYLYSANASSNGTPVMITSSTAATAGTNESLNHFSASGEQALLVVKRVSGSGTFQISSTSIPVPPPVIVPGPSDPNEFTFVFDTVSKVNYAIEFKDSLDDPIWQTLQSIPGDGSSKSVTNSISTIPQRFFRLRVE